MRVDSRHVRQPADIFILATHQPSVGVPITYTRNGDDWQILDGQLDSLPIATRYTELPEELEVPVYQGNLIGLPGEFLGTVGYRLDNGVLVFNGLQPIHLMVANGVGLEVATATELDTTARFLSWVNQGERVGNPFNVSPDHSVGLGTTIVVDPEHVGQQADILMVAIRSNEGRHESYQREAQQWGSWDEQVVKLTNASISNVTLEPIMRDIPIFAGLLNELPGEYEVYIGYRLNNGVIIYNGREPIRLGVPLADSLIYNKPYYNQYVMDGDCVKKPIFVANGLGIDAEGQMVQDEQTCFSGAVRKREGTSPDSGMYTDNDTIEASAKVTVNPQHQGQACELYIVAVYQTFLSQTRYMRVGNDWQVWNEELGSLQSAQSFSKLPSQIEVDIYEGPLSGLAGEWTVFVGYSRQGDDTILFNGIEPIELSVTRRDR